MIKSEDSKFQAKPKVNKKFNFNGVNPETLKNVRIIQKHLVYVIGLSSTLANKEILSKMEYFGQYGTILKIIVNKTKAYNPDGPKGPSFSAYISYSNAKEASIAILSIDNIQADDHVIRASFGTTKYCTFFLKSMDCPNKECLYLHNLAEEGDIISKDDMSTNKNIFQEQQVLAVKLADIFNPEVRKKLCGTIKRKSVFPPTDQIYLKESIKEKDPENAKKKSSFDANYSKFKKSYKYEDYKDNPEDEVEYILVHKDNGKNNYDNHNRYHKNKNIKKFQKSGNYKYNFKSEDDTQALNTNANSDNNQEVVIEKVQNDPTNTNEVPNILINNSPKLNGNHNSIYRKRDNSRFEFVKNNKVSSYNDIYEKIPEFISDIAYKKISRFTYFKKFTPIEDLKDLKNDLFLFEKELKNNNNPWAQFITKNGEEETQTKVPFDFQSF